MSFRRRRCPVCGEMMDVNETSWDCPNCGEYIVKGEYARAEEQNSRWIKKMFGDDDDDDDYELAKFCRGED